LFFQGPISRSGEADSRFSPAWRSPSPRWPLWPQLAAGGSSELISMSSTSGVEQSLANRLQPKQETAQNDSPGMMMMSSNASGKGAGPETLPDLSRAVQWLNSAPLNRDQLKGQVALVDFWTYSCINSTMKPASL
jgi:hypothetical protein